MKTIENDTLLAEFLGITVVNGIAKNGYYLPSKISTLLDYSKNVSELGFSYSYDWLFMIIEELENKGFRIKITSQGLIFEIKNTVFVNTFTQETRAKCIYETCIKAIEFLKN